MATMTPNDIAEAARTLASEYQLDERTELNINTAHLYWEIQGKAFQRHPVCGSAVYDATIGILTRRAASKALERCYKGKQDNNGNN